MSTTIQSIADATVIAGPPNADSVLTAALLAHTDAVAAAVNAVATAEHASSTDVATAATVVRWFAGAGDVWAQTALSFATVQFAAAIDSIFFSPASDPGDQDPHTPETPADPPTPQVGETYGDFKNRTGQIVSGPDGEIGATFRFDGLAWVP